MILLVAVVAGFVAALIRSWIRHEKFMSLNIHGAWLVFAAFLPQYLAMSLQVTRERMPNSWMPYILVGSQLLLIVFVWLNRKQSGMWVMGVGLLMNFLVMILNHGFMPLSPETAQQLIEPGIQVSLTIGERVGFGKDILLTTAETKLWFLSDIFLLPKWTHYRAAFSAGDVLISVGAFLFLWSLGGPSQRKTTEEKNDKDL
jgi:hypothetical protein